MSENKDLRYPCPCCGSEVLEGPSPGSYEICPVCGWEDDDVQFREPDLEGGANEMSLNQARANYAAFGSCEFPAETKESPANESTEAVSEDAEEESDEDYREDL